MKKISILLILQFLSVLSFSQKIENVHAEQQGKQVVITYDIIGAQSGQTFDIKLLYSQNGYDWKQAMEGLTGDIGNTVSASTNKIIIWDVLQDEDRLVGTGFMFKVKTILNVSNTNNDTGTFTDTRDGKIYKWVKIGNQIWMAENLNYKLLNRSWCYDNNSKYCQIYGRLYDKQTAKTACPEGWHLPLFNEWIKLINFMGGEDIAGGMMKQSGTISWLTPNASTTNSFRFNALPSGARYITGSYDGRGKLAYFWSGSNTDKFSSWGLVLSNSSKSTYLYSYSDGLGYSVRCVQDKYIFNNRITNNFSWRY